MWEYLPGVKNNPLLTGLASTWILTLMTFKPGNTHGLAGRPAGARSQVTMKYLEALQKVVTVEAFQEVTRRALEDALSDRFRERQSGRAWISKHLLPPDPVSFLQMFAPTMSLTQINTRLREIEGTKELALSLMRRQVEGTGPGGELLPAASAEDGHGEDAEDEAGHEPGEEENHADASS